MAEASLQGIDVSHYQGKIDWQKVVAAEQAFAFIKATDGIGTGDSMFAANWKGARSAGIRRGSYHFFRPLTSPLQQSKSFLAKLGDDLGELPPVLDFELLGGASAGQALSGAKEWMDVVEAATGRKPILYTGPSFWSSTLHDAPVFTGHHLWIAQYTSAAAPRIPSPWSKWTFWQHSEMGVVPGIAGFVDLNRFNGTLTELEHLCERISLQSATAVS